MRSLLFLFLGICFLGFTEEEEKLAWDENRKLTWDDFKGVPNRSSGFVASTNSGMSFSFSYSENNEVGTVTYSVVANFYPKLSWTLTEKDNLYILEHEQTHFDITELHARKLRKELVSVPANRDFKKSAEHIYNTIEAKRRSMQEAYDAETDHSNIKEAEFRWRNFVREQLNTYQDWK